MTYAWLFPKLARRCLVAIIKRNAIELKASRWSSARENGPLPLYHHIFSASVSFSSTARAGDDGIETTETKGVDFRSGDSRPSLKKLTGVLLQLCQATILICSLPSVRPLNKHQEVNCGKVASLSKFVLSPRVRRCFSARDLDEVGSFTILPLRQDSTTASFGAPPLS